MTKYRLFTTRLPHALALVCSTLAIGACQNKAGARDQGSLSGNDAGPADPVPVEFTQITEGAIEDTLRFSANLEAEVQVQVLARAPGQVTKLLVEEGQQVKQGEILLRIESDEQRSALERTETELAQAGRVFKQRQQLHTQGVVSDQELELAEFDVKRLKIARADAARMLRYTTVRASVGGTITLRQVKLGDYVVPNQRLFDITDFGSIVAKVFVPEKELRGLKPGLSVRIYTPSSDELLRDGTVDRVSPVVDPRSGTVKVTISMPNTEELRPGAFVDVELITSRHDKAVLLPRRALVYDNDQPYAFKIVDEDHVQRIRVEPTLQNRSFIEPARGFALGDRVVVAGQVGLKDNALVAPTAAPEPQQ